MFKAIEDRNLGAANRRAMQGLPSGWELTTSIENVGATLRLYDSKGVLARRIDNIALADLAQSTDDIMMFAIVKDQYNSVCAPGFFN